MLFQLPRDKYYAVKMPIKLKSNEQLGIIVSQSWNHTFLMVKHVLGGSKAQLFGIKPKDRICMVDNECHPHLDMKKLNQIFRTKSSFTLTILRKRGSYVSYEQPDLIEETLKNLSVDSNHFVSAISLNNGLNDINCDSSLNEKNEVQSMDIDDSSSWHVASTCDSFQDHLDQERCNKIANRYNSPMTTFERKVGQPNVENFVDQWLNQSQTVVKKIAKHSIPQTCNNHASMSASFQENKENYQPVRINGLHYASDRFCYAHRPDNILESACYERNHNRILQEIEIIPTHQLSNQVHSNQTGGYC